MKRSLRFPYGRTAILLACMSMVLPAVAADPLRVRAEQGDPAAQWELAVQYRDGKADERKDESQAIAWAHRAADGGYQEAMAYLGESYFRGRGVKPNLVLAVAYLKAAGDGFAAAQFRLGDCYFGAQGVAQDIEQALICWERAAELGHGRAASSLAMYLLSGEGFRADRDKGLRHARRAVELSDPSGLVLMGELAYQDGDLAAAKSYWQRVAAMNPVRPTGQPTQPSAEMASQQGADLLRLMEWRNRKPEPGKFALVNLPHVHQGYNNCGASSCAMVARFQGSGISGWDFKKLCPSPVGTGTDWDHLVQASRKAGLHWKLVTFPPDPAGFETGEAYVRNELDQGRPVIIDFKFYGDHYSGGSAGHTLNLVGYIADEDVYILCNPAIATPGLHLISRADLEKYWRSDGYSALAGGKMSRPIIVIDSKSS